MIPYRLGWFPVRFLTFVWNDPPPEQEVGRERSRFHVFVQSAPHDLFTPAEPPPTFAPQPRLVPGGGW